MRLIDADAKALNDRTNRNFGAVTRYIVKSILKDTPTVDAVEVVRCRECRYYRESENPEMAGLRFCYRLRHPTEDRKIGYNFADDDFCSYGERRENEQTRENA